MRWRGRDREIGARSKVGKEAEREQGKGAVGCTFRSVRDDLP